MKGDKYPHGWRVDQPVLAAHILSKGIDDPYRKNKALAASKKEIGPIRVTPSY
jgi:hypothetical protein